MVENMFRQITTKHGEIFELSLLHEQDRLMLGQFFDGLSSETRSRFGPHPLTNEHALLLSSKNLHSKDITRYIVKSDSKIIGYFIIDFTKQEQEKLRYC